MKYKKVLLKVSGEAFADSDGRGIDKKALESFTEEVVSVIKLGVKIAIVVGGGNFWRERDFRNLNLPRIKSDEIGMMATFMNGMVLSAFFQQKNIASEVFSAKDATGYISSFSSNNTKNLMQNDKIIILTGGTGHPFFTTDSAAILRALELDCDAVFKGTKVDGIYDADPKSNSGAKKFTEIAYEEAINQNLKALDKTAYALAMEKRIPLIVFNIFKKGNFANAVNGKKIGTLVF